MTTLLIDYEFKKSPTSCQEGGDFLNYLSFLFYRTGNPFYTSLTYSGGSFTKTFSTSELDGHNSIVGFMYYHLSSNTTDVLRVSSGSSTVNTVGKGAPFGDGRLFVQIAFTITNIDTSSPLTLSCLYANNSTLVNSIWLC